MKLLFSCLCAALLLMAAGPVVRACQYCQMAAAGDPEAARLAAEIHGGSFPLDGITSRFAPAAPSASLSAPPAAASVATTAADLPATVIRHATPPPPVAVEPVPAPATVKQVLAPAVPTPSLPAATAGAARWSDAGLLGLLTVGGLFCWRTRRATVSLS